MRGFVYYLALLGGSWGAVAVFNRRWLLVKGWGPAMGMASAAVAYLAAETHGNEKWALGVFAVNAVLLVYIVMRRLVRTWSSNRER